MANIEAEIQRIAHQFVQEIVKALVGSSIQEFAQLAGKSAPGRPRAAAAPAAPKKRGPKAKAAKAEKPQARARKADKKRNRRSSEEIADLTKQVIDHIHDTAGAHPDGISVSEIAKAIKADIEDITRPIHRAVEDGRLKKKGEKRLTRYFPGKKD